DHNPRRPDELLRRHRLRGWLERGRKPIRQREGRAASEVPARTVFLEGARRLRLEPAARAVTRSDSLWGYVRPGRPVRRLRLDVCAGVLFAAASRTTTTTADAAACRCDSRSRQDRAELRVYHHQRHHGAAVDGERSWILRS